MIIITLICSSVEHWQLKPESLTSTPSGWQLEPESLTSTPSGWQLCFVLVCQRAQVQDSYFSLPLLCLVSTSVCGFIAEWVQVLLLKCVFGGGRVIVGNSLLKCVLGSSRVIVGNSLLKCVLGGSRVIVGNSLVLLVSPTLAENMTLHHKVYWWPLALCFGIEMELFICVYTVIMTQLAPMAG